MEEEYGEKKESRTGKRRNGVNQRETAERARVPGMFSHCSYRNTGKGVKRHAPRGTRSDTCTCCRYSGVSRQDVQDLLQEVRFA